MSTEISQALEQAIQSLVDDGKEPSVALIKGRLKQPVPMPAIILALKAWKKGAKLPDIKKAPTPVTLEQRVAELEQQVAQLTERLNQLEGN